MSEQLRRPRAFSELDAGELREWTARALAEVRDAYLVGPAIDRLAGMVGDLPTVLRDLADDVDAIRSEPRPDPREALRREYREAIRESIASLESDYDEDRVLESAEERLYARYPSLDAGLLAELLEEHYAEEAPSR